MLVNARHFDGRLAVRPTQAASEKFSKLEHQILPWQTKERQVRWYALLCCWNRIEAITRFVRAEHAFLLKVWISANLCYWQCGLRFVVDVRSYYLCLLRRSYPEDFPSSWDSDQFKYKRAVSGRINSVSWHLKFVQDILQIEPKTASNCWLPLLLLINPTPQNWDLMIDDTSIGKYIMAGNID